jgi:hypothetical protein
MSEKTGVGPSGFERWVHLCKASMNRPLRRHVRVVRSEDHTTHLRSGWGRLRQRLEA